MSDGPVASGSVACPFRQAAVRSAPSRADEVPGLTAGGFSSKPRSIRTTTAACVDH